jgi:hypothetical protein
MSVCSNFLPLFKGLLVCIFCCFLSGWLVDKLFIAGVRKLNFGLLIKGIIRSFNNYINQLNGKKGKAIRVTGHGGP